METRIVDAVTLLQVLLAPETPVAVTHHGVTTTAPNWEIGPREVPEHMLFYVASGGFAGEVAGAPLRLQAGELYWQQPGVPHHLVHAPGVTAALVYFFRIGIGTTPYPRLQRPTLVVQERELLPALVAEMVPATATQGPLETLRIRCLFGDLFCRALQLASQADTPSPGLSPRQARRALAYIRAHLGDRYPMRLLAAHLELHPDYFARRFKETFGAPPQTVIKTERIRLAMGLLRETNLTVSEVSHRLGYAAVAYFSNQFLEVTGQRPSAYRRA